MVQEGDRVVVRSLPMKPHTKADTTAANRLSSIRDRSGRRHPSIIMAIDIVLLLTVCGCVVPSNKGTRTTTRYKHHEPTIRSSATTQNELSDAEKDKLFRGFERWRVAKGQGGSQDEKQGQPARAVGDAEVPDE
jgi:hypothetical protein